MSKYHQTATYWAPSTLNEYGEQSFEAPVVLSIRWEQKTKIVHSSNGVEQQSESIVYTTSDVREDGFILLGESNSYTPKTVNNAYPIKKVEVIPAVNSSKVTRKIWL